MTDFTRARKSTKRMAFKWSTTAGAPYDLTGCTLLMLVDTEKVESTPDTPVHVAEIAGVITDPTGGEAYFPVAVGLTGAISTLYFEVWITDAAGEEYVLDSGKLVIKGSLK